MHKRIDILMATIVHQYDDVRIYHKQAYALRMAGWSVAILNSQYTGTDDKGIRFIRVSGISGNRAGRMSMGVYGFYRAILKLRPRVCHLHDPELLMMVPWLKRHGILVVYDSHEFLTEQLCSKPWILQSLRPLACKISFGVEQNLAGRTDLVIGATPAISAQFSGAITIRNLPTTEDFCYINQCLSATNVQKSVCYIGAITEQRGIFQMIKACAAAQTMLYLAGRFENDILACKVKAMPEWQFVQYLGVQNRQQIGYLLAKCSIGMLILHPTKSYQNSLPIKLYEYLASGMHVIASDFPAWNALNLGDSVVFTDPMNIGDIAQTLQIALQTATNAEKRKEKALEFQKIYCFEAEKSKLISAYTKLLEKGK